MFGGCGLIMFAGLMAFGNTNDKRRQAKFEKRLARIALVPLLQVRVTLVFFSDVFLMIDKKPILILSSRYNSARLLLSLVGVAVCFYGKLYRRFETS